MGVFMEISDISVEQIIKQKASNNSIIFKVVMIIACILAATVLWFFGALYAYCIYGDVI